MMRQKTLQFAIVLVAPFCLAAQAQSVPVEAGDEEVLAAATQGLCHSQVAMLGESATHGDGHALAFKVALVERLVDQCGFDSVFFEASHYEFINLNRRLRMGRSVTADELSSAVGGKWEFNQEFQPLAPFLVAKANSGRVFLGGLDDQLGQMGQDYANVQMITELTDLLPHQEQQPCNAALHKRIYNDYPDASPYSKTDEAQIETCLSDAHRANAVDKTAEHEQRDEMLSAAQRWIGRDFSSDAEYMVNRDRSMFQNLEWLLKQQPNRQKVIIWAATVHIAKQADPTWADHSGTNFGSFVNRKYATRAFSLGFSSLTGTYRAGSHDVREVTAAPPDSIEARAMRGNDSGATFVGSSQLAAMGTAPAALFRHSYQTLSWSNFLDGVVIFREEHSPRTKVK